MFSFFVHQLDDYSHREHCNDWTNACSESIPNPSIADTALPSPSPIASTNGTVTGPVVTPALSQATLTNSSVEKIVKQVPEDKEAIEPSSDQTLKQLY